MNLVSDNYYAETLIKLLGARFGSKGSTAAGAGVESPASAEGDHIAGGDLGEGRPGLLIRPPRRGAAGTGLGVVS